MTEQTPQTESDTELYLRLRIAAASGLGIDAIPHELANEEFVFEWEKYLEHRQRVFGQTIHPLACHMTLELLGGFPWPKYKSDYEWKWSRDAVEFRTLAHPEHHALRICDLRSMYGATWWHADTWNEHADPYHNPAACVRQSRSASYHGVFPLHEDVRAGLYRKHGYILRSSRNERNAAFGNISKRDRLIGTGVVIDTVVGYVPLEPRGTIAAAPEHDVNKDEDHHVD
ncbi:MAG TPA: hypothetical protein PLW14_03080 [Chlorobiota bacterium]|nr:hypothetical protein [Chlorobiota bacterium]